MTAPPEETAPAVMVALADILFALIPLVTATLAAVRVPDMDADCAVTVPVALSDAADTRPVTETEDAAKLLLTVRGEPIVT